MASKPVWTDGLFLTQHHLQQLDRYHEQLLHERLSLATAWSWGVRDVAIDERALAGGSVRISRLSAVLPDGTAVRAGDGLDAIAVRSFEGRFGAQVRRLDVYVALTEEGERSANVDLQGSTPATSRFVRRQGSAVDFNTGSGTAVAAWAQPNLRILFGDEPREGTSCLRIARLVRLPNGAIGLQDNHVPPVHRIGASPSLVSAFQRLIQLMAARRRALVEFRNRRVATEVGKILFADALAESLPEFVHFVDQGLVHPEQAYLALARFVVRLSTLALEPADPAIPRFDFLELGDVFEPLFGQAMRLIELLSADRWVEVPLQKRADGMYFSRIEDQRILRRDFYLAASGTMPEARIRDTLPRVMKIASWNHIGAILNSAVNGARIEPEFRPPGELPTRAGVVFFRVQRTPEFWPDIVATGTLAMYHHADPSGTVELLLYAVEPANAA